MEETRKNINVMLDRFKWLSKLLEIRHFNMGKNRSDYIYILYATLKTLQDAQEAQEMICKVNKMLGLPLDDKKIQQIVDDVNTKTEVMFTNKRIIHTLDITEDEVEQLGIGQNMRKQAEREDRKFIRIVTELDMIQEYEDGKSIKEIVNNHPGIAKRTLERWLAPYAKKRKINRDNEIQRLRKEGETITAIAAKMNCSRDTVYAALAVEKTPNLLISEKRVTKSTLPEFVNSAASEFFTLYKTEKREAAIIPQEDVLNGLLINKNNIAIFGGAGTGKSYLINQYLNVLSEEERKKTLVVAPTGLAAAHINGSTIHAAFQFDNGIQKLGEEFELPASLNYIDRVIIDEISMVRIDVFTKMIQIVKQLEEIQGHPIQVIVVGDFGQLPPVAIKTDKVTLCAEYPTISDGFYAFQSPEWEKLNFTKKVLTRTYRQTDSEFIEHLNEIKYGKLSAIQWFNENTASVFNPEATYICGTNKDVETYTQIALDKFKGAVRRQFTAKVHGLLPEDDLPCPQNISLSVGMRVMTICNTATFKNGSLGTIEKILKASIMVRLDNNTLVRVGKRKFELSNGTIYEQLPVILAFALTVNKAEGCTFDAITIVPGFFAPGQLYTALSRCRTVDQIYIMGELTKNDLKVDLEALKMSI